MASNHKIDGRTCGSRAGLAISAIMVAIFALMIGEAVQLRQGARFAPLAVGIPALILAFAQLAIEWHALGVQSRQTDDAVMRARQAERRQEKGRALILIGWFAALVVLSLVLGVLIAFPVFVFGFLRWHQKERLRVVVAIAASFPAIIYGVFDHLMGLRLWAGVVPSLFW